jgi:hypothetical protein
VGKFFNTGKYYPILDVHAIREGAGVLLKGMMGDAYWENIKRKGGIYGESSKFNGEVAYCNAKVAR